MTNPLRKDSPIKHKMDRTKITRHRDTICDIQRELWHLVDDAIAPTNNKLADEMKVLIERAYDYGKRMSAKLDAIRAKEKE